MADFLYCLKNNFSIFGNIFIDSNSERCIVWYDHVSHWTSLNRVYDFQLILYPDGLIKINYRDMLGDTDSATVGIINQDGQIGLRQPPPI